MAQSKSSVASLVWKASRALRCAKDLTGSNQNPNQLADSSDDEVCLRIENLKKEILLLERIYSTKNYIKTKLESSFIYLVMFRIQRFPQRAFEKPSSRTALQKISRFLKRILRNLLWDKYAVLF